MRPTMSRLAIAVAAGSVIALVALALLAWQYSKAWKEGAGIQVAIIQTPPVQATVAPRASSLPAAVPTEGTPGDRSAPVGDAQGLVTIRFACSRQDLKEFESLAAAFHEQYLAVAVEVVAVEDVVEDLGNWQSFWPQLASAADTAYYYVDLSAAQTGLLRDLTPFIQSDPAFVPEDYFPGMLEAFQALGGTWALPSQARMHLLFFDKHKFDEAGVAYPTLTWTNEDFLAAALALTQREDGETLQYGFVDYGPWAEQSLVLPQVSGLLESQPPLTAPAVVEAVQWYTDLALRYQVMPPPLPGEDGSLDWASDLLDSGRAAMWSYVPEMVEVYRRDPAKQVGVVALPTEGDPGVPVSMYGYTVSTATQHPQESWLWLRYLSYQRLLGPRNSQAQRLPARRSVAEQSGYWDGFDEQTLPVIRYAAEHLLVSPASSEKKVQLYEAITAVFTGKPVKEALTEAQAALEEQLAQAAQATPVPVVVATPQPPPPAGAATVTFAPPPGVDAAPYRALANAFNRAHADVQVSLVNPDQAGTADCFADMRSVEDDSTRAELLDLQPLLDADPSFSLDDFHPRFVDALRFQGDLWGIPIQAKARVVFYNRALFDAAGVPYPVPGWTLDDFLGRAIALTEGEGTEKQYGFLPLNGSASDLQLVVALQGASLWDELDRPEFDAPDVVAAVQWYADLAVKHGVMPVFASDLPRPDPAAQQARNTLVRTGRVAMWTDFSSVDRGGSWPADGEVGMAPLPVGVEGVSEFLYEGLFIARNTSIALACWEWLKVVSGHSELVRGLPARRSLLESGGYAGTLGRGVAETYCVTLGYAELRRPMTAEAGAQTYLLHQALAGILAGESARDALAKAQQEAQK